MRVITIIGKRWAAGDRLEQPEESHALALELQLPRHFDREQAAVTPTRQEIRSLRLALAQQRDKVRGHLLNPLVTEFGIDQAQRLESIAGLLRIQMIDQVAVTQNVPGRGMDEEHGGPSAAGLEEDQ